MNYVSQTLDHFIGTLDLTPDAATNFRYIAHTIFSRRQAAAIGATEYGECITEADAELKAKGLIVAGKFAPNVHRMALSHQGCIPVALTGSGHYAARDLVEFETDLRRRGMSDVDFDQWLRDVATKLDD